MALFNTKRFTTASSSSSHQTITFFLQLILMFLLLLVPFVKTTSFRYNSFEANSQNINYQGDASARDGGIDLTTNRVDKSLDSSVGRALYKEPVQLYDASTGKEADFITHFTFNISVPTPQSVYGDGLAFFLAPNGSEIPPNAGGGCLGIFNDCSEFNSSENPVVAVEFDTFRNSWDPYSKHVGIDINSISSSLARNLLNPITNGVAYVWISYTSSTNKLRVNLTHDEPAERRSEHLFLSLTVNLRDKLPEWVNVGFSATTGAIHELHKILSWEFNSTNFPSRMTDISPSPSQTSNNFTDISPTNSASSNFTDISPTDSASSTGTGEGKKKVNMKLLISFGVCASFIVVGVSYILFVCRKKIKIIKTSQ